MQGFIEMDDFGTPTFLSIWKGQDGKWYKRKDGYSRVEEIDEGEAVYLVKQYVPVSQWDDDLLGTELEAVYKSLCC